MSEIKTQSCDECGILRERENHWLKAAVCPGAFMVMRTDRVFEPWPNAKILDLCSESCAVKAMCKAIGQ